AGDDGGGLGQRAQDDHDHAGGDDHPAALDLGEADQADILGKAGIGEGVEHAADEGGEAVGPDGPADILGGNALLDDLAGGEDIAGGLDHGDDHHHHHREDGGEREGRPA